MLTASAGRPQGLVTYRDDGVIAQSFGRFVEGQLPPLLPATAGATVTIVLSAAGVAGLPGIMVGVPVIVMALAGLGSGHPHDGRLDWLVPPMLQLGEYVFLTAVALAWRVPVPMLFAVLGVIALHHYDVVYRIRLGMVVPRWLTRAGLGWEGRMLVAALGAMLGVAPLAFALMAVYLWVLFGWESTVAWIDAVRRDYAAARAGGRRGPRTAGQADGAGAAAGAAAQTSAEAVVEDGGG